MCKFLFPTNSLANPLTVLPNLSSRRPEALGPSFQKSAGLVPTAPLSGQDAELAKSIFLPSQLLFPQENDPPKPQISPPTTHSPQFSLDFAPHSQSDSTSGTLFLTFTQSFLKYLFSFCPVTS